MLIYQKLFSCPKLLSSAFPPDWSIYSVKYWSLYYFTVTSRPFPTDESLQNEDIYNNLEDMIEYVWSFSLWAHY